MLMVLGGLLIASGLIIHAIDWHRSKKAAEVADAMRTHADQLTAHMLDLDDWSEKPVGGKVGDQDPGEMTSIMRSATREALKNTKQQIVDSSQEISKLQARRGQFVYLSWVLILAGTIMQIWAGPG